MCARFTLRTKLNILLQQFAAELLGDAAGVAEVPRYNVAPTQQVAAVRIDRHTGKRQLAMFRWGLVPSWADDLKIGQRMINARSDSVASKPAYREAFRGRRCLIVADGFYEWQPVGKKKQPYFLHRADDAAFAFAGLWERWSPKEGPAIETCTIITTDANELVQPIHDRMPVIVDPADYAAWIDPTVRDQATVEAILQRSAAKELIATAVSTTVNSALQDTRECIEPLAE